MPPIRPLALAVTLLSACATVHAASPWLPPPGGGEVGVSYAFQSADELYQMGDIKAPLPTDLEQWSLVFSGRYGLSDALALDLETGYAESDFVVVPGLAPDGGRDGVIDTRLGVTWRLVDEFAHDAAPTVAVRLGAILQGDYDTGALPAVGDGADGVELSVLAGKLIGPLAVAGELGYRNRNSGVPDDTWLRLDGQLGVTDIVGVRLGYLYNDSDGDLDIGGAGFTPARFPEVEEDHQRIEAGVTASWKAFSYGLTYGETIDGRNTADSSYWGASLGYGF